MPTKKKMKRFRYVLAKEGDWYTLRCDSALTFAMEARKSTKRVALAAAARRLKWFFREFGQLSELVVRTERGTFSAPRTYGKDPRKSKG